MNHDEMLDRSTSEVLSELAKTQDQLKRLQIESIHHFAKSVGVHGTEEIIALLTSRAINIPLPAATHPRLPAANVKKAAPDKKQRRNRAYVTPQLRNDFNTYLRDHPHARYAELEARFGLSNKTVGRLKKQAKEAALANTAE